MITKSHMDKPFNTKLRTLGRRFKVFDCDIPKDAVCEISYTTVNFYSPCRCPGRFYGKISGQKVDRIYGCPPRQIIEYVKGSGIFVCSKCGRHDHSIDRAPQGFLPATPRPRGW